MDANKNNICKPEFELDEAERVLASLSLTSIVMGEYMVIMKQNFDVFIFDEPFLAAMLLFHTQSGDLLGRVWNKTVSRGRAVLLADFEDACRNHFCNGRLCLGFPEDDDEEEATKPFLVSQTPIPRKYSRACLERLDEKEDANACRECLKMYYGFEEECVNEETPPAQLDVPTPEPTAISEVVKFEAQPSLPKVDDTQIDYVPEVAVTELDYVGLSGKMLGEQEELELTADPACVEVVHTAQPGVVGEGVLSVRIHAEGRAYSYGPVNLRTEEEVQLLRALVEDRYNSANQRGKGHTVLPQYSTNAERGKSVLHPDVVKYANYIFTTRAMRKHKNGRRRNINFGRKRSQVIKVDPVTGEKIYPPGHPLHSSFDVKAAGNDEKLSRADNIVSSTNHPDREIMPSSMTTSPTANSYSPWSFTPKKLGIDCAVKCVGGTKRKHLQSGSNGDDEYVELPLKICMDKSGSDKNNDEDDQSPSGSRKGQGSGRRNASFCGECNGCLMRVDCGECLFCRDKAKLGGPNKLRKKCAERVCTNKSSRGSKIKRASNESKAKSKRPRRTMSDPNYIVRGSSDSCASGDETLPEKSWRTTTKPAMRTYTRDGSKRRRTVEL